MAGRFPSPFHLNPTRSPPPWQNPQQLRQHLSRLLDDVALLKVVADELEAVVSVKVALSTTEGSAPASISDRYFGDVSGCPYSAVVLDAVEEQSADLKSFESLALEAATSLQQSIESQLSPLLAIVQGTSTWEEAAAVARMSERRLKTVRNRKWRRRRRQRAAEALRKEQERYDQADQEADEWRARQIAKDIARRKMEKMKEVAKQKAKEDRRKLEDELELVLIVEKLQELRTLRIERLKKQGCFFPEEDNKFMERVRAAVEEEERQAAAAADTSATAAAIANAAGKTVIPTDMPEDKSVSYTENLRENIGESTSSSKEQRGPIVTHGQGSKAIENMVTRIGTPNTTLQDEHGVLPPEFYHYYHGSMADMGTLIEVRRTWDTFILPGGSRMPGHWVEPPAPADAVWASCLLGDNA